MNFSKRIILYLFISFVFVLAGCGGDDAGNDENTGNNADTEEENNTENTTDTGDETGNDDQNVEDLSIGDSATFNDVTITLNEVRVEPGGEFDEADNDKFVVVNMTAENNSDEEVTISSMLNVELYDEDGYSYTTTILTEGIQGQFDGTVAAGKKLRGEIPFDVPDSGSYELHYSDPFGSNRAIWIIDANDLE
ncbi:DUF4352 domain-containing protein [Ornithinibacillus halophilus]|uniref:DUF4352 domain-containing protein n=1 Tax=Ornithinibacillus halophilus TaxID=930117 RepID=A0A1M5LZE2_9BACI|nr:DUF4352 domain-containing protein [Ornithinibacillus halophilus]SHG70464.1 protein of unknown function [Ornithinibacillus halophilus]